MISGASFHRISLVGVGLIGGSWGLALKQRGWDGHITGCDRLPVLDRALAADAIDEAVPNLAAAVHDADLVILAMPVGAILEHLSLIWESVPPRALVTDTGSTKRAILDRVRAAGYNKPLFAGGHPLAGKEQSGIENASASLFEGTRYVISPLNPADLQDDRLSAFRTLIELVGARPFECDAETHDRAMALLSHLPQLLSTGLASVVADEDEQHPLPLDLAAAGFRDMTRLAESPYDIWFDVCLTNQDELGKALDALIRKLMLIRAELATTAPEREFQRAAELRRRWRNLRDVQ